MLKLLNGLNDKTLVFIKENFEDTNAEILNISQNLKRGITEFFGLKGDVDSLLLGVDPWTKHLWADKHYKKLFFNPGHSPGDVKFLWEFMKHNFLPALGKAYRLTEDKAHVELGVMFITKWLKSVEHERGASWAGHPHICQRMINWLIFLELVEGSDVITTDLKQEIDEYLDKQWQLLENEYERPANNHRLISISFVILSKLYHNKEDEIGPWLDRLKESIEILFLPDGGFAEQSTSYHRFSLESLLIVAQALKNAGLEIDSWLRSAIEESLAYFDAILEPSGRPPVFGDNSDEVFLIREWPEEFWDIDYLYAFAHSLDLMVRKPQKTPASQYWLIGLDKETQGGKQNSPLCSAFKNTGHYVLRNPNGSYVFFRAGEFGLYIPNETRYAHSHSDQLGLVAYLDGTEILTDPGTYRYNENDYERMIMKDESFHSTLRIGGNSQARYCSSFIYEDAINANGVIENNTIFGYMEKDDWAITRKIDLENKKLVITDRISADAEAEWFFALSAFLSPKTVEPGKVVLQEIGSLRLVTLEISEPTTAKILPGYVSHLYSKAYPSQRLYFNLKVKGEKMVQFVFAVD
ncbi:MAG: heparinase II/III family protein [Firmicutes bacterium]|nr:heparinase II/III family protein [Bacillota bacterium]MDD4263451.1 heparinase II/III family protein [Bacillota bacterium]MDD4694366.1 heparinase II/III family protein [Bacillota bacterium]